MLVEMALIKKYIHLQSLYLKKQNEKKNQEEKEKNAHKTEK